MSANGSGKKGASVSWRLEKNYRERLLRLVKATERPNAFFLDRMLAEMIPVWEKKYESELAALAKKGEPTNSAHVKKASRRAVADSVRLSIHGGEKPQPQPSK